MVISENLARVANTIVELHREVFDESPSPMKLQKLAYYSQAYQLAFTEGRETLFEEDFQAWVHGPVIMDLYQEYKEFGWRAITSDVPEGARLDANSNEYELVRSVVEAYGRFDGAALSTMTHRETPWLSARGDTDPTKGSQETISKASIAEYFIPKLKAHGAA